VLGKRFQGQLIDVSSDIALVSIMGLDGFIKRNECSWYHSDSCLDNLTEGERTEFEVKAIDENRMCLELTKKFKEEEPWAKFPLPKVGDKLSVTIFHENHFSFYSKDSNGQIIEIPTSELSWQDLSERELNEFINQQIEIRILSVDNEKKQIIGSLRQLETNPWPEINKKIRPESKYIGKVTEVHEHFLRVDILDGIIGIIPKERLQEAGGVYEDFKSNIIVGQGIEVVVTRVFVDKQKIHLKLKN
jgi:small subunit ribosomal protein S1